MARLLEDLSKVSMAEERQLDLRLAVVEPASLIEQAVHAVSLAYADKGVTRDSHTDLEPGPLLVDPDRLAEVLGNLLANALRHTPPGGRGADPARTRASGGSGIGLTIARPIVAAHGGRQAESRR